VTVVIVVLALAGWAAMRAMKGRFLGGASATSIRSLAVLPLHNLSADPEQEYFVDGMTEELTTVLAQVKSLKVISRTSSTKYKDTKKSLPQIGRELGVDAVIEGSVLRAGDKVRVTAQLVRAATDEHLWAQSYDRDLKDVLALQSGVARLIAHDVVEIAFPNGKTRFVSDRAVDPAAHEDFLMGRYYWNTKTEDGLRKAIEYFRSSVRRDSTYARAYAAIADYYNVLPFYTRTSPREAFPQARVAALRALALDDSLGPAHAALALERAYYEWDWAGAEREFQRALALTPSESRVHLSYSRYLVSTGRSDEGMAELKRAEELDPLTLSLPANEAMVLFFEGRYDDAIAQLRKVLALDASHPVAHWGLGLVFEQKGMYAEAMQELREAMKDPEPDPNFMSSLAHIYASAGRREEARRVIARLKEEAKKYYVSPYHSALVYAGLGDKDGAFAQLNAAAEDRSTMLVYLRKDPRLSNLRSDPRFQTLLARIGLPGAS
jgi:TolB-like protein/Flp pilus assembly protein TadD